MPSTSIGNLDNPDYEETASDLFTRLSIAMCEGDDGTRPVNPAWPGSDISWNSPAFEFHPVYPLPANKETTIRVLIRNFGTMDATGVTFECAYNIYLGNEHQGNVSIANQTIPLIPSQGEITVEVSWMPPDTQATHGCLHARVFDNYSLLTYPKRIFSWESFINPQAGNRNVRLVPIEADNRAVAIPWLANNFGDKELLTQLLVSPINGRKMWPRGDITARFRHTRFGFATRDILQGHALKSFKAVSVSVDEFRAANVTSYLEMRLKPNKTDELYLLIPPEEFPPRGRKATFQVEYDIGGEEPPVQHIIYLVHKDEL